MGFTEFLGKLVVGVDAPLTEYDKKLRKAERLARKRGKRAGGQFATQFSAKMKIAVGGFTTAITVRAISGKVKSTIAWADALAKTADKLGVSTDALQEYRFGAKLAGIEQNTLDMSLQRFMRRLGEAQQGTGELLKPLKALGIPLRDNNGLLRSSESVLNDYADALSQTTNPQIRMALAMKAFDSEGVAMVNMLKNGSAGLREYKKEANEAGLVVEEGLLRNAEKAQEVLDVATGKISMKVNTLILENIEPIEQLAESLMAAVDATSGITKGIQGAGAFLGKASVDTEGGRAITDILESSASGWTTAVEMSAKGWTNSLGRSAKEWEELLKSGAEKLGEGADEGRLTGFLKGAWRGLTKSAPEALGDYLVRPPAGPSRRTFDQERSREEFLAQNPNAFSSGAEAETLGRNRATVAAEQEAVVREKATVMTKAATPAVEKLTYLQEQRLGISEKLAEAERTVTVEAGRFTGALQKMTAATTAEEKKKPPKSGASGRLAGKTAAVDRGFGGGERVAMVGGAGTMFDPSKQDPSAGSAFDRMRSAKLAMENMSRNPSERDKGLGAPADLMDRRVRDRFARPLREAMAPFDAFDGEQQLGIGQTPGGMDQRAIRAGMGSSPPQIFMQGGNLLNSDDIMRAAAEAVAASPVAV